MEENKDNKQLYEEEEEVKPVKLSKKSTSTICVVLAIICIIVLICFRGCSITKEVKSSSNTTDTSISVQESSDSTATKGGDISEKNEEKSSSSEDVNSSLAEESKSTEKVVKDEDTESTEVKNSGVTRGTATVVEQNTESIGVQSSSVLKEVQEPVLNDEIQSTGLVSSKSVYQVGDSYLYEIKILTLKGDNQDLTCKYYCPKKTWDALSVGDSISITYQMDSMGNTSVLSISK